MSLQCHHLITFINLGKHCGTLVCHVLQDLKIPSSNLDKDEKIIELEMMYDLREPKYTPYGLCLVVARHRVAFPWVYAVLMISTL